MARTGQQNKGIARAKRERRREEAQTRQEAHEARSNAERLALLRQRGHGHCGEAVALSEFLGTT